MDQSPPPDEPVQPPIRADFARPPAPVAPLRPKSHFFGRLVLVLVILGLLGSLAVNILLFGLLALAGVGAAGEDGRVVEKYYALEPHGTQKVAILSIEGLITSGEGFFRQQVDHAKKDWKDGNLKAIVVRVNSPGGTVSGSDYMFHYLRRLAIETKMPIVVSMGAAATSGGYYVSMSVGHTPDTIFAEPTTTTGSIGVLFPLYSFADLAERWGIKDNTIATNPLKTAGSPLQKLTPEQKKLFQGYVDDAFAQFKKVVREGRQKFHDDPAALDKLATGQVFMADQALDNGLIDKIGYVEDAIDRAIALANLDKKEVKVVKYKAAAPLSELLFGQQSARPRLDLSTLLESASQAYYLCASGRPTL
jgi:protease-4